MFTMNNNQGNAITKPFEFRIIKYTIKNLCYKVIEEDFLIVTPEICINGVHTTKWQMKVCPKLKRDGRFVLSVHLERLYFAPGPDNVWASSKIEIFGEEDNDEKSFSAYHEGYFKFTSCEVSRCSAGDLLRLLGVNEYKPAVLKIVFHLIIKSDSSVQRTNTPSDTGLRLLSNNLRNLFRAAADSDFKIITENGMEIGCHKAVLSARSSLVKNYHQDKTVDMGKINYKILSDVLTYIYSGDIEVISKHTSARMYELLSSMQIRGIKDYYRPKSYNFTSGFELKKFEYCWEISSASVFGDRAKTVINLQSCNDRLANVISTWSLTLYLNGIDNSMEYVSINANVEEGSVPDMCCFTFALRNGEGDVWSQKSLATGDELCLQNDKHVRLLEFISRECFESKIKDCDKFCVVFILDVYSYNGRLYEMGILNDYLTVDPKRFTSDFFYNCLSDDLARMLKDDFEIGDPFDTFVEVKDGTSIGVHKCILNARVPTLRSKISEISNKLILNLSNMKRSVVLAVLRYIYSGKFLKCEGGDILYVYQAAKYFNLIDLKEKCSEEMGKLLRVETACATVVFAREQQDESLENSALHFIRDNRLEVRRSEDWRKLHRRDPTQCKRILEKVDKL